ncbi:S-adenosyl-L-methionine-dependent methyltransferase [Coniochaeta ligniaria NRRL 30616]|uniref:S-adenosyl-L-methionine-dependent methyltransferase n=1 Tax=Coniochaeta ligniaria NRRL 30616 TaxID=1408157 RepID=A0A1J7IML8_9PEZI|nr:S-adenosyl-L-methionine-dependent methyltransferase [Coniochaeta ligniaria NRRL 30616]
MSEYRSGESASQPTENAAFTAPENPVTRNKAEVAGAKLDHNGGNSHPSAHRGPGQDYDPEGGNEWGMGRGTRGSKPVDEREAKESSYRGTDKSMGTQAGGDGDPQIADVPAGEGKVADAADAKHGVQRYGDQDVKDEGYGGDFSSGLDRKKAEQAAARDEIKQARQDGVDVDGGSEHRRSQGNCFGDIATNDGYRRTDKHRMSHTNICITYIPRNSNSTPFELHSIHSQIQQSTNSARYRLASSSVAMSPSSPSPIPQESSKVGRKVTYLSTLEAYDKWATVYDIDGNVLQAIDDEEVMRLLPQILSLISTDSSRASKILDLGCGTGRNTLKLLGIPGAEIYGLDLSPKMLEIAKQRCTSAWSTLPPAERAAQLEFRTYDVLDPTGSELQLKGVDVVISTLVVEHMPLVDFFLEVNRLLTPGGLLLVTNMHSDMGAKSQAGFNDPATGDKIRPVSYNHSAEDLVEAARAAGYELVSGSLSERGVDEDMARRFGPRAGKWVGVQMWMGGIFKRHGVGEN